MGNRFTADGSVEQDGDLKLSNAASDVLFDVLTIAGCAIAATTWQWHLVTQFADAQRVTRGADGFDLGDVPWTADWQREREFFRRLLDLAAEQYGWDRLRYTPGTVIAESLATFRSMVAGFVPTAVGSSVLGDWRVPLSAAELARCAVHDLCQGRFGCRLCDERLQPRT